MRLLSAFAGLMIVLVVVFGLAAQSPSLPSAPQAPNPQSPGSAFPSQQTGAPGSTGTTSNSTGTRAPGSGVPTGSGQDQLFIELKDIYDYTQVNPNTKGPDGLPLYSFLIPGNDSETDLTLYQDHAWGTNRIQYLGIFRETNDVRWDPEHSSLQRGYFRVYNKNSEINFGDYLVNYSRFTYNQNIKGLSLVHKFNQKDRKSVV